MIAIAIAIEKVYHVRRKDYSTFNGTWLLHLIIFAINHDI